MLLAIFTGGRSRRMGGYPKGLLPTPSGGPIVRHLADLARELRLDPILVGSAEPYAQVVPGVATVPDLALGPGPLGGLSATLKRAGDGHAVIVACDQPFLTREVLQRFAGAPSELQLVASRASSGDPWDPFPSRWDGQLLHRVSEALRTGARSFQELFEVVRPAELELSPAERLALADWDTPADRHRGLPH